MNTQAILASLLVAPFLLAGCSDDSAEINMVETVPVTATAAPQIAELPAAPLTPAPYLSISLRGVADGIVESGEPLRIAVRLSVPRDSVEHFELAPANGSWADAIVVELTPNDGGSAIARATPVGTPDMAYAMVDNQHVAGGLWRISGASTRSAAPGDYTLKARLVIVDGDGWTGEALADGLPLQVMALSDASERVAQRAINHAQDAMLDGNLEQAAALLDAVLANTPDDVRLLSLRGAVAERAGNMFAAMICVNRALQAGTGIGADLPPLELNALQDRVLTWLVSEKSPDQAAPPAWSWPPEAVFSSAAGSLPDLSAIATSPAIAAPPASKGPGSVVPPDQLDEERILADPAGQWAVSATAGSEYGAPNYGAVQMIGVPDVPGAGGDNSFAWCHSPSATGLEWVELVYARPVSASEVRVRQSNVPGTIVRIEAIAADGSSHLWWEGTDPYRPTEDVDLAWFAVRVPTTDYLVAKLKITLDLAALPGWKEIDAVQLVAGPR